MINGLSAEICRELFEYRDGVLYWADDRIGSNGRVVIAAGAAAGFCHSVDGYWRIKIDGRSYKRSRLVFLLHRGHWPASEVDHINRIRHDDRIENLRDVTKQQNQFNTAARGTAWNEWNSRWQAYIRANGKQVHLGYFDTESEGHAAYLAAKEKYHRIDEAA